MLVQIPKIVLKWINWAMDWGGSGVNKSVSSIMSLLISARQLLKYTKPPLHWLRPMKFPVQGEKAKNFWQILLSREGGVLPLQLVPLVKNLARKCTICSIA
uniref:Uncharacterized protein n=1 Tax=Cacopsylla melanoneura TaxID=428564 RepID=A0A8D9AMX1_9HEMI